MWILVQFVEGKGLPFWVCFFLISSDRVIPLWIWCSSWNNNQALTFPFQGDRPYRRAFSIICCQEGWVTRVEVVVQLLGQFWDSKSITRSLVGTCAPMISQWNCHSRLTARSVRYKVITPQFPSWSISTSIFILKLGAVLQHLVGILLHADDIPITLGLPGFELVHLYSQISSIWFEDCTWLKWLSQKIFTNIFYLILIYDDMSWFTIIYDIVLFWYSLNLDVYQRAVMLHHELRDQNMFHP